MYEKAAKMALQLQFITKLDKSQHHVCRKQAADFAYFSVFFTGQKTGKRLPCRKKENNK